MTRQWLLPPCLRSRGGCGRMRVPSRPWEGPKPQDWPLVNRLGFLPFVALFLYSSTIMSFAAAFVALLKRSKVLVFAPLRHDGHASTGAGSHKGVGSHGGGGHPQRGGLPQRGGQPRPPQTRGPWSCRSRCCAEGSWTATACPWSGVIPPCCVSLSCCAPPKARTVD